MSAAPWKRRSGTVSRRHSALRRFLSGALSMAILLTLAIAVTRHERISARNPSGRPVIADGDSLKFGEERIRMRGIDAPEYSQMCERNGQDYACGKEARAALAKLAGQGAVTCKGWEQDRYGRLLATCSGGGVDLNKAMVESGWAVSYGGYTAEEAAAKKARRGLWAGEFQRPSQWRAQHGGLIDNEHDFWTMLKNALAALLGFS